ALIANFRTVIPLLRSFSVTDAYFLDPIGPFILGFVVGPDQELHHDANGEELYAPQDQHHPKNEQRPVTDILSKTQFDDQKVNVYQEAQKDQKHTEDPK